MRRSRAWLALAAGAMVVLAGCSPSDLIALVAGQGFPGPIGAVSTGAAPSAPDPSPISDSPAPSEPQPSDLPAGWTPLAVPNESLRWAVPPDWSTMELDTLRQELQDQLDSGSLPEAYHAGLRSYLKDIAAGEVRLVIAGVTPGQTATSAVMLVIGPAVPDLQAAAAEMRSDAGEMPDSTALAPEPVTLALGDGLSYQWVQDGQVPAQLTPAVRVVVVTRLPDGRCIWVEGAAPRDDTAWPAFVTQLADQIRIP